MRGALKAFIANERGSALIEYGLAVALIALGLAAALADLSAALGSVYETIRLGLASIGPAN